MKCVQCGSEVITKFCPECGQRTGVKRLTPSDSLADFWTAVIGLDGIFLRTLKDLTLRPGFVARSYINGVRLRYFGPIGYFFIMATLMVLSDSVLSTEIEDKIEHRSEGTKALFEFIENNPKWFMFLVTPFLALAARYFFSVRLG